MLIHSQLIPLDATDSDRWFYFPIVGLLGLGGIIVQELLEQKPKLKKPALVFFGIIAVLLATRTMIRTHDWQNGAILYFHDAQYAKPNFIFYNSVGSELIKDGQFEKAKPYLLSSVKEHPYSANLNNLAIVYLSEHNVPKTKEYLLESIKHSDNFSVYENYANFLLYYDKPQATEIFIKKALLIFPNNANLWLRLAYANSLQHKENDALFAAKKAYELDANDQTIFVLSQLEKHQQLQLPNRPTQ